MIRRNTRNFISMTILSWFKELMKLMQYADKPNIQYAFIAKLLR